MEENVVLTHGSLFSGIGGFDLAAEKVGFENIFSCEKDEFCDKLLKQNFPNVKRYKDIYEFDGREYNGRIDIVSGGFPCQPFSVAGKRQGENDDRHLWPQMLRVIAEIKPRWVVAENVPGLLNISGGMVFEQCCINLEAEGYEVQAFIIPAISKNAPHRRDRLWIIANAASDGRDRRAQRGGSTPPDAARRLREPQRSNNTSAFVQAYTHDAANADGNGFFERNASNKERHREATDRPTETLSSMLADTNCVRVEGRGEQLRYKMQNGLSYRESERWEQNWYEVATQFCRVDDGLPNRVDRIKALGNAIVPQVAIEIFRAIKFAENYDKTGAN